MLMTLPSAGLLLRPLPHSARANEMSPSRGGAGLTPPDGAPRGLCRHAPLPLLSLCTARMPYRTVAVPVTSSEPCSPTHPEFTQICPISFP